jgi:hypothetical protein
MCKRKKNKKTFWKEKTSKFVQNLQKTFMSGFEIATKFK